MKKTTGVLILMLITVLVMFGCSGSGGGTAASSGGGNSTSTPSTPGGGSEPNFTVHLLSSTISVGTVTANKVRVVVSRTEPKDIPTRVCQYDDNGVELPGTCIDGLVTLPIMVFKDIQDVDYLGSGSFSIGIPRDNLVYTLDVITNRNNSIISYGSGTAVYNQGSATIQMSNMEELLNMKLPSQVVSTQKFDVTLNNGLPFAPGYNLAWSLASDPSISDNKTTSSNKCTFTAPTTLNNNPDSINFVGTFYLNSQFLKPGEQPSAWTRIFPSLAGEQVFTEYIPLVSVTITPQ